MAKHDKARRAARLALNQVRELLKRLEDEARDAGDSSMARGYSVDRYMAERVFRKFGIVGAMGTYRAPQIVKCIGPNDNARPVGKLLTASEVAAIRAAIGW